jgi:predicted outer membrane protein
MATENTSLSYLAGLRNEYIQQRMSEIISKQLAMHTSTALTRKQQKKVDKWLRKIRKYDPNYTYTKSIIGQHTTPPKTMKVVRHNSLSLPTDESMPHANL